jgi:hypothetical protein
MTYKNSAILLPPLHGRASEDDRERNQADENFTEMHGGSLERDGRIVKCGVVGIQSCNQIETTSVRGDTEDLSECIYTHPEKKFAWALIGVSIKNVNDQVSVTTNSFTAWHHHAVVMHHDR